VLRSPERPALGKAASAALPTILKAMPAVASTAAPTLELVEWVARRPRTYAETMEAWSSHCPRLTVWEDAVIEGLVRIERSMVVLTPLGRAALGSR
jgi:hypothetical protein